MSVGFLDIGSIDYKKAWDFQEELFKGIIDLKIQNRNAGDTQQKDTPSYLLFCEHPHVYTLGKSGDQQNLLLDHLQLVEKEASFYKINRGGDITYHGPGQLVGYPILDLDNFFTDIHKYLRFLEEIIIKTLADFGIKGERYEGFTGVWIDVDRPDKARKICAMGVRSSRWVTMHGFAFNINTDMHYFDNIVPCGIKNKKVTSLQQELGREVDMLEVKLLVKKYFSELFDVEIIPSEVDVSHL